MKLTVTQIKKLSKAKPSKRKWGNYGFGFGAVE